MYARGINLTHSILLITHFRASDRSRLIHLLSVTIFVVVVVVALMI